MERHDGRAADSPRIRILPPLVYVAAFGAGGALDRFRPWPLASTETTIEALRWLGGAL